METPKNINSLIIRYLSGNAGSEESEFLIKWLEESHDHRLEYFRTKRLWLEMREKEKLIYRTDKSWRRLENRIVNNDTIQKNKVMKFRYNWKTISVAASIAILIGISLYQGITLDNLRRIDDNINEISAPPGSRTKVSLPDGSSVWLNSGSSLRYTNDFGLKNRKVNLSGEAYFNVRHLGNIPFVVNTSALDIKVLGTEFNVKAYPDENSIETTLIKGEVEVNTSKKGSIYSPIVLKSRQKIIYEKGKEDWEMENVEETDDKLEIKDSNADVPESNIRIANVSKPEDDAAWKDEKLIIKSETLDEMARKLERYYNVEIIFRDDSLKNYRFSGTLDQVTIEEVFRAIESTAPIEYTLLKNQIFLSMKD